MIQKLFFPPSGDKQTILSAQYASTFVNLKYTLLKQIRYAHSKER